MEENRNIDELLKDTQDVSLFNDSSESTSLLSDVSDDMIDNSLLSENDIAEDDTAFINQHNERIKNSPEFKARIVYDNFINTRGQYLSGKEKRRFRRECLANAKKGRYDYLFDEEKIKAREARQREKFEKLNKPVVRSANDLSDDTKTALLEMADSSVVPEFNKETGSFEKQISLS